MLLIEIVVPRAEILRLIEGLRRFITFHKRQIARYLEAVIPEGHRATVGNDTDQGPTSAYRDLLNTLEEEQGHIELVKFIEPCQLLNYY